MLAYDCTARGGSNLLACGHSSVEPSDVAGRPVNAKRAGKLRVFAPVQLRARVAWAYDWMSNPALSAAFQALPGTSFVVSGAPVRYESTLTSVAPNLPPKWSLLAKFDGEFASSADLCGLRHTAVPVVSGPL